MQQRCSEIQQNLLVWCWFPFYKNNSSWNIWFFYAVPFPHPNFVCRSPLSILTASLFYSPRTVVLILREVFRHADCVTLGSLSCPNMADVLLGMIKQKVLDSFFWNSGCVEITWKIFQLSVMENTLCFLSTLWILFTPTALFMKRKKVGVYFLSILLATRKYGILQRKIYRKGF